MMMAMLRLNVPSVFVYGGSIMPGRFEGHDVTVVDVFEAVGQHAAGACPLDRLTALEKVACPGDGACGGQFTANTMACVGEAIGLSLPNSNMAPAPHASRADYARAAGEAVMRCLEQDLTPRKICTREAFENAAARGRGHRRLHQRRAAPARDGLRMRHRLRPVRGRRDLQVDPLHRRS